MQGGSPSSPTPLVSCVVDLNPSDRCEVGSHCGFGWHSYITLTHTLVHLVLKVGSIQSPSSESFLTELSTSVCFLTVASSGPSRLGKWSISYRSAHCCLQDNSASLNAVLSGSYWKGPTKGFLSKFCMERAFQWHPCDNDYEPQRL